MVMTSKRPPEVEDRAVPGHWEGDLLRGNRQSPAAIATLVERSTRYLQLVALPEGAEAERVADAPAASITTPRPSFGARSPGIRATRCSSTGASVNSGVDVYFCDPQSPWQRGSNENTNGLLRQYFPRRQSLEASPRNTWTRSPTSSTADHGRRSASTIRRDAGGAHRRRFRRRALTSLSAYGLRSTAL